jgi:putative aminopeptidase FrvX
MSFNEKFCLETFERLLSADSTTGMHREVEEKLCSILDGLGCEYFPTRKGGIIADLGGTGETLCITAHLDDIGLMVRKINPDGTLNVCPVGGLYPFYCLTENVRIHTFDGRIYTGSVCRSPGSIHVTEEELRDVASDFRKNICVVLDENVRSREETEKLGIETGNYIALYPRFEYSNGYLKSRFIDDKACAAAVIALIKDLKEENIVPSRHVIVYFAVYEEIGHGTTWLPEGVKDILAVDIAPTGPDQTSDERKVSIFVKDSRFPYNKEMTEELRRAAIEHGVDYVMDVFTPHYGTDGDGSILAGYDIRHAAIGPGTLNSHSYERTHIEGLRNTYDLLRAYIL